MVDKMPRIQAVVLPYLEEALLPDYPDLTVGSWIPNVKHRTFPLLNVRRLGGLPVRPDLLDRPVIELTAFTQVDLPTTEQLLLDARMALFSMKERQVVIPGVGYIHSYFETMGPTQFDSLIGDTWRVQMLVQLGLRPTRN